MWNPFRLPVKTPEALPMWPDENGKGETWPAWDKRMKAAYPVRFWLSKTLPIILARAKRRYWSTPLYWLRTHTYNRYHMIDIRNPRNGYKWGWFDRSEGLLFAAFAMLSDFVEKEYPGYVDWDYDEDIRAARDEILALYKWWKIDRKIEHDADDKLTSEIYAGGFDGTRPSDIDHQRAMKSEKVLEDKDQEMFIRLVKIRRAMWT
jgi:hypothetical protein